MIPSIFPREGCIVRDAFKVYRADETDPAKKNATLWIEDAQTECDKPVDGWFLNMWLSDDKTPEIPVTFDDLNMMKIDLDGDGAGDQIAPIWVKDTRTNAATLSDTWGTYTALTAVLAKPVNTSKLKPDMNGWVGDLNGDQVDDFVQEGSAYAKPGWIEGGLFLELNDQVATILPGARFTKPKEDAPKPVMSGG